MGKSRNFWMKKELVGRGSHSGRRQGWQEGKGGREEGGLCGEKGGIAGRDRKGMDEETEGKRCGW